VVASPSAARALVRALGVERLRVLAAIVAIGPTTHAALDELGIAAGTCARADLSSAAEWLTEASRQRRNPS
jgi:uroporphyrinogen-III synthase